MTAQTLKPTLRAANADDAPALGRFLQGLCAASRRQRFHGPVNPHSVAEKLCRADGARHQAWLAWVGCGSDAVVVGEARFVLGAEGARAAELALVVADEWRGRGVADALMHQMLKAAREAGVQDLYGDVLEGNERMLAFMRRHGFEGDLFASGDVLRLHRTPTASQSGRIADTRRWLGQLVASALAMVPRGRAAAATFAA